MADFEATGVGSEQNTTGVLHTFLCEESENRTQLIWE